MHFPAEYKARLRWYRSAFLR